MRQEQHSPKWLNNAVGYEIYIRSFADSNSDGVGDLEGIMLHLDYLAWLGVDIIWITPIYPSPMADQGYDVASYIDIAPIFGNFKIMEELIRRAHIYGLKVVLDIVPNHTSSEHPWFQAALADPASEYRDYYLWRDPKEDGGPPNNWVSHFGGPAWTLDEASGQYYCHLFLPEQPDLNWRNPAVREMFDRIVLFWFEIGADGLRVDVAHALFKDEQLRDNPQIKNLDGITHPRERFWSFEHRYDLAQPESLDVYRRWQQIASRYDAALIGETYVLDAPGVATLVPGDGLHLGFWFAPMKMQWNATEVLRVLRDANEHLGNRVGWVQSSHDESRPVSRFGEGGVGRARSLGLATMFMGLPGVVFVYQGEELGLQDGDVPAGQQHDPIATRNPGVIGRDACRTPMPWQPGRNLGFSNAAKTWLPQSHTEADTVAVQQKNPSSYLHKMRDLISLRKSWFALDAEVSWLDEDKDVVSFRRGDYLFALNAGEQAVDFEPGGNWTPIWRTVAVATGESANFFSLDASEALVARQESQ